MADQLNLADFSFKIKNYKCFGPELQGLDKIKPINIIVGRNNSGKSTLLEFVQWIAERNEQKKPVHKISSVGVEVEFPLLEGYIGFGFSNGSSGGPIPGNHIVYGRSQINKKLIVSITGKNINFMHMPEGHLPNTEQFFIKVAEQILGNIYFRYKHIKAERSISPEKDGESAVQANGAGATNIIQQFINKAKLPTDLIKNKFLDSLNKIVNPDSYFQDINVQQLDSGDWEIFFEEVAKGNIPLSQSGSGFQTIIMVLIYIQLIPYLENSSPSSYFFAFEELENNLHPSLQRRLFSYLRSFVIENNSHLFITTHSNVVIDLFANDENSQIVHVQHDSKYANIKSVESYASGAHTLHDLGYKASDLLQSNGVIWVEGPSDRIYINRWIELWSNGTLQEGNHYQCVFYGGKVLSHFSAEAPATIQELVNLLHVNRNSVVIMDSDRSKNADELRLTKKRIIEEMNKIRAFTWVTSGREIENYIPVSTLSAFYKKTDIPAHQKYTKFSLLLDKIQSGEGKKYLANKFQFAVTIRDSMSLSDLKPRLDLDQKMTELVAIIRKWNHIEAEEV